jgi:tripartite-type tricarboxylate transporter receptor subunit TctC
MLRRTTLRAAAMLLATLLAAAAAQAQAQAAYPSRPIRLIVPFPPGGITDIHARTFAERMSARLNQQVIVDNRPGAGGRIGTEQIARAAPDGYTIGIINGATLSFLPALVPNLNYRSMEDFHHLAKTVVSCPMLVLNPSVPVNTMREFVAYARERPGQLNLGTPGNGNFAHIQGEQLMKLGGIKLTHVPFKGEAEVLRDLIAGHVQLTFAAAVAPQVAAGQVKVIATTCPRRSVTFPDSPSIVEAGFPDLAGEGWQGMAAPAGLPPAISETLAQAIRQAAADAGVVQRMNGAGLSVDFLGPAEFREFIARDMARWKQRITEFNIKID